MSKDKNDIVDNQENFILKKIRYYQGSVADFDTFWKQKSEEGEKEECPETKACKVRNAELNKAFEIVPVTDDSKEEETKPKELTPDEEKEVLKSKESTSEDDKKEKKHHKKDDKEKED